MLEKRIKKADERYESFIRGIYKCRKNGVPGASAYFFNKCFKETNYNPYFSKQSLINVLDVALSKLINEIYDTEIKEILITLKRELPRLNNRSEFIEFVDSAIAAKK